MIFRHLTRILCWMLIVHSTIKNVRAISFDDIFEYLLDGIDESDESSEELANSNLNVTCKNCTLSVECHNCTQSHTNTQSTLPMQTTTLPMHKTTVPIQTTTQINQQLTSSSLPTPTIPAPERVVEIVSSNIPSESSATAYQSVQSTSTTPVSSAASTNPEASPAQTANTKSVGDGNQVTEDGANLTTDEVLNSSESVTGGDDLATK